MAAAETEESYELDLELPADRSSVTEARHAVAGLARTVGAAEESVALAVTEAVANAVVHAFGDREDGKIHVAARTEEDALVVAVSDDGAGMSPKLNSPGLGLGIALITQLAREVRFRSSPRGTTVTMSFDIPGRSGREEVTDDS